MCLSVYCQYFLDRISVIDLSSVLPNILITSKEESKQCIVIQFQNPRSDCPPCLMIHWHFNKIELQGKGDGAFMCLCVEINSFSCIIPMNLAGSEETSLHMHRGDANPALLLMPSGPEKSVCIPTVLHTPVLCIKFSDDTAPLIAAKCFQHLFAACLSWANVFDDNFQDAPSPPPQLLYQKKESGY